MAYWLVKSEPATWSWQQQVADKKTAWTGVRNHQAAKYLKEMRAGDLAFFYHSVTEKAIVGVVEIVKEAYPDPTDPTGKFVCVDVKAKQTLPRPISLADIKANPKAANFMLIKQARLSVMPVESALWENLLDHVVS